MNELSRQVKDEHLATVEHFAMTNEAKPIAWILARVLVERKRWGTVLLRNCYATRCSKGESRIQHVEMVGIQFWRAGRL